MRVNVHILKKVVALVLCVALIVGSITVSVDTVKAVDRSTPWLLSANRPAYSSSNNGGDVATFATDGRLGTQWGASAPMDDSNAVDGNYDTYWLLDGDDNVKSKCNQSLTVDLGAKYTLGRVLLQWQVEYGNIWDLQVSEDGKNFKTVYRQLEGNGEDEDIRFYAENVRYVRMQGILMGRGSGYSIRELQVYEYQTGDEKVTNTIGKIPEKKVVNLGRKRFTIAKN